MNAGVLQFTLGLGAGGFLRSMEKVQERTKEFGKSLLELPGIGELVTAAFGGFAIGGFVEQIFGAFERGDELANLAKRTGESAKSLYQLQQGFKAIGLSADDVSPAIFAMQRALGGVNDMGESTADIFARMHLNAQQLRTQDAATQFRVIANAMAHMGQSAGAQAASMIFGRQQGGNILQLARSGDDFSAAMKKAAAQGEIFARNAERFERIEKSMIEFKESVKGLFLGLAEGAAPGVQKVMDLLNGVDFTRIGQRFSDVLTVMAQSIRDHEFGKLIELGLTAGFEAAGNYASAMLSGIMSAMQALWDNNFGKEQQSGAGLNAWAAYKNSKYMLQTYGDQLDPGIKAEHERNVKLFEDTMKNGGWLGATQRAMSEAFKRSFKDQMAAGSTTAADALKAFYARELGKAPKAGTGDKGGSTKAEDTLLPKNETYRPDYTTFEKMGFVMAGVANPAMEHAQTTAQNTTRMVQLMEHWRGEAGPAENVVVNQPL